MIGYIIMWNARACYQYINRVSECWVQGQARIGQTTSVRLILM